MSASCGPTSVYTVGLIFDHVLMVSTMFSTRLRIFILCGCLIHPVAYSLAAEDAAVRTVETDIAAILRQGEDPGLRWSRFPDYQQSLDQLYQHDAFHPLWTRDGVPVEQASILVAVLAEADSEGLNASDYDAALLSEWIKRLRAYPDRSVEDVAGFDVALSLSLMRYASNLYLGRINPRNVDFGLSIEPKKLDLPELLRALSKDADPHAHLQSLEPKLHLYRSFRQALMFYQELAPQVGAVNFSFPQKFSPGSSSREVPALRHFLTQLGDMAQSESNTRAGSELYSGSVVEGVKRFQRRHGLHADGVIGRGTVLALNVPLADRVEQIRLGMERLRWLPEQMNGPYLLVNIPSFQLFAYRNGMASTRPDMTMNVIVGEAIDGRHTPVFSSDMTNIIFRPYWNVPYQITVKEMLPLIRRNPGYLAQNNLEIVSSTGGTGQSLEPSAQNIAMLQTGALRLRQKPGPKNALGLVKFAFPNNNNVYLHSTPTRGLFQRARRDFSHGCIRLQDPVGLAEFVLQDASGEWTRGKIEEVMNTGDKSRVINLRQNLPVYIFYSTVMAGEDGQIMFHDDIYGHDLILQNLLAKGFPYPP
ncbi:MAG: hypothetical protein RIQ52_1340 [Pseudomonadota bacterium]|jgi:murein L,D-transpeptidase YcbB/YkuD